MSKKQPTDELSNLFGDLQREIERSVHPLFEIQRKLQAISVPKFEIPQFENFARQIIGTEKALRDAFKPIELWSKQFAAGERRAQLLDKAGFLPHTTTPMHLIDECNNEAAILSDLLENYYRENWGKVRSDFTQRVRARSLEGDAAEAFVEALVAHEAGLYRLVCRGLFPEIERIARIELSEIRVAGNKSNKVIPRLQTLAAELYVSDVEPQGYLALRLFERLTSHLYEQVGTENHRKQLEADAVPNRNAAVHGLVDYKSFKNSLNALFMTDYAFQIVWAVKRQHLKSDA